jgi:solute:Na+ symporter, SSS family
MHWIDFAIFVVYMFVMLGVGFYFLKRNKSTEDYYVGGRSLGKWHIGLSVVATDVGGGFSIGLGGLGFLMGLSGSWMLFTGLIGAWLSAVLLIPKVSKVARDNNFMTFPQLFTHYYDGKVALVAGIISAIGYIGFSSSQLLAGAKLASATFPELNINTALLIMGIIAIVYTGIGGLKAVIYTDTIQWAILLIGLIFIGIPFAYVTTGGWEVISASLSKEYFSLSNITWQQLVNWGFTIIPIWFVGMTLYQRIYASKSAKEAQKAWYIAGLFEYPVMAFMGVILGLLGKVAFDANMFADIGFAAGSEIDEEMGLPLLLNHVLPVGLLGIMLAAYFSAILSTADSCLMAVSGNVQTDLLGKWKLLNKNKKHTLRISQIITILIGTFALLLASKMQNVLSLMLYSYAFMVSGLLLPVLGALFWKKATPLAALLSMIGGGGTTISLIALNVDLPLGLDANIFGITIATILFFACGIIQNRFKYVPTVSA